MNGSLLDELKFRGLLHQVTDEAGLEKHLSGGTRRGYVGFDPTADSLTIGNLVPMLLLRHLQLAGHTPVVIAGGGTGLIGDPSGKSAERQLQSRERVEANVQAQMKIFSRVLDFSAGVSNRAILLNNADWLTKISFLDMLRDAGKHFSVNAMIQKESVRERLNNREQGISYTEFSYMILQAFDYLHLFRDHGVTLQMGGSDQWGNITAGLELIRRTHAAEGRENAGEAFGLTAPLVTKADGGKFGKSEKGAVWLSAERTSPFAFYQFWLNAADEDAGRFLRLFTFLPREEILALEAKHAASPGERAVQRALAHAATALLHGETEAQQAMLASKALFSGEVATLPESTLLEVLGEVPSSTHPRETLGAGVALAELLVGVGLAQSKREAREFLTSGSVSINGVKAGAEERLLSAHLLHGKFIALRRGKKNWHLTRWE